MQRDSIDFSSSDVGKLFRRFLFPTVMGMVFSAVFVITDGIFVGRGIGSDALDIVFSLIDEVYDIVMASGIQIVVFLSGLQNVPRSLYEAADVEGCSKWEAFWTITFPMVSPLLIVNIIYTIIDFFMKTDSEVMKKINEEMTLKYNYGFSSAMAWVYFAITIVLIGASALMLKGVVSSDE